MRIVALVPMRHNSERVPGKNYRSFAGVPLYRRIVQSLLESERIDEIVIDTDSPVILEDAARVYPEVHRILRPEHLRDGHIPMNRIIAHDIEQAPADLYLQTHSTNPLLRGETIRTAIDAFLDARTMYDSLFSVTRVGCRLWDALARPINHNAEILLRTQDLPAVFEENSNLYLFTRGTLENEQRRIGRRPLLFEIDRAEAWDIDEEIDFRIAELLYQQRAQAGETEHEVEGARLRPLPPTGT